MSVILNEHSLSRSLYFIKYFGIDHHRIFFTQLLDPFLFKDLLVISGDKTFYILSRLRLGKDGSFIGEIISPTALGCVGTHTPERHIIHYRIVAFSRKNTFSFSTAVIFLFYNPRKGGGLPLIGTQELFDFRSDGRARSKYYGPF